MIELVDTHCHIQSVNEQTGETITRQLWQKQALSKDELVARAAEQGVNRLICVGCTPEDSQLAIQTAAKYPNTWASIGIHPHEAKDYSGNQEKLQQFAKLATEDKVVAVGECGLDYFYNHSNKKDQLAILEFQLNLAATHNLPLIFHVREAFDDFWPIFERINSESPLRGVLHSFTDSLDNMNRALEHGLFIGVNGIATFTKDQYQTTMYKQIPLSNLVLETDSPFLTPPPFRGKVNEPKSVRIIAEFLAELRGVKLDEIAAQTTTNARSLLRI